MWTDEQRSLVVELSEELDTAADIANELANRGYEKKSPAAIRGILRRWRNRTKPTKTSEAKPKRTTRNRYEIALKRMGEIRDSILNDSAKHPSRINGSNNGTNKILSIADTHIPFYNKYVIQSAVNNHRDASCIILGGDILEVYSVSRWPKQKSILLRHEYEIALAWIKKLSEIFPDVYLIKGNHEERLQSYFSANVDPVVSFMTEPDILTRLSEGYAFNERGKLTKTYGFDNVHYTSGLTSWFTQIGKVIFAHPNGGSSVPARTVIKCAEWFTDRGYDFEALVVGHSHRMSQVIWNDKLLIEQGCACLPLEYEYTAKMSYKPQTYGYSVIYVDDDGHVDFNKSQPIYCGTGAVTPCNVHEDII